MARDDGVFMVYDPNETICAIASATGGGARGIVRVSGSDAIAIVGQIFEPGGGECLNGDGRATATTGTVRIKAALRGERADMVLPCEAFLWPRSRSYTREPVAELHTFGSTPLLEALLAELCHRGARLAEPGEFTLRAFLAGRIDLTQAEAVLGVIDARTEGELSTALTQLAGGIAHPLQTVRDELLQLLAELEAGLDFVEEDIEFISTAELQNRLGQAACLLVDVSQQMASRTFGGATTQVVLTGRPNAGKSSLFNALVARLRTKDGDTSGETHAALVSPQRGTTRDYLTAAVDLDGIQCDLIDTAGIDLEVAGRLGIEEAAQSLADSQRDVASIRLHCVDATEETNDALAGVMPHDIVVVTKADLVSGKRPAQAQWPELCNRVATSVITGEGLDQLSAAIRAAIVDESPQQVLSSTTNRCSEGVRLAQTAIERAGQIAQTGTGHELIAAELRIALAEIGKVVGVVYTDDILDRIFSTFCIGK
jgi:tRNA modification GTPase